MSEKVIKAYNKWQKAIENLKQAGSVLSKLEREGKDYDEAEKKFNEKDMIFREVQEAWFKVRKDYL